MNRTKGFPELVLFICTGCFSPFIWCVSSLREELSQNLGYMGSIERIQRGRQLSFYIYFNKEMKGTPEEGQALSLWKDILGPLRSLPKGMRLSQTELMSGNGQRRPRSTGAFHIQSHLMKGRGGDLKTMWLPANFPSSPPTSQLHNTKNKILPSQDKPLNALPHRSTRFFNVPLLMWCCLGITLPLELRSYSGLQHTNSRSLCPWILEFSEKPTIKAVFQLSYKL